MPKVSVITPVYCDIAEKLDWLIECIDSVRSQTMVDWEMILIDDKSTIEPAEAKFRYSDDARIRWFENAQNSGPAKTRNTAVALADSECIIALDSDDMFAGSEVLEAMYDAWLMDPTRIIYGNLQMYVQNTPGVFSRAPKIFDFGEYSFELAMNLKGFIPVTAMHSKACHNDAGGWKPELVEGLEDVEKWIMAGKRGYCGQRVNIISFLYRKQDHSRSYQMVNSNQFENMQQKIKSMHSDIYAGRFPVACCGKGEVRAVVDPIAMSQQAQQGQIVPLSGYEEKDLEWVKYVGGKNGRHDILGKGPAHLPSSYTIFGTGQIFQIHKGHHDQFESLQRLGFQLNQPDPRNKEPEPEPVKIVEVSPEITEVPAPEMSTILRLDSAAASVAVPDIQPMPEGFTPMPTPMPTSKPVSPPVTPATPSSPATPTVKPRIDFAQAEQDYLERKEAAAAIQIDGETKFELSVLQLSPKITDMLAQDSMRLWTVERLARTTPQILSAYPGIGIKTANGIIAKAKELINTT